MSPEQPQSLASHRRWVPIYHFVTPLLLLANVGWAGWVLVRDFTVGQLMYVLMSLALFPIFFYLRGFALAVQDRVIRLEERLRLERLLPPELKGRVQDFSTDQLIGLRFASDAEVPALARAALDERLGGEDIKKRVTAWRPDHHRA